MSTFRAAVVHEPDGPASIEIVDMPERDPGPGQIGVTVAGAAVNPVDLATAAGVFHRLGVVHQSHHTGLGWDFSGTVAVTGPGVDIPVGTRIAGLVAGFDRDVGACAEQVVVSAADVAQVPDELDLATAAAVPLNALAAAQAVDLLDGVDGGRLLVTGAAGAVGGDVVALAQDAGWQVTGLGRPADAVFIRGLGAESTTVEDVGPGPWDAVVDAAVLRRGVMPLLRDGGAYIGVQPGGSPEAERGVVTREVVAAPEGRRLRGLLEAVSAGSLPVRVHARLPLDQIAEAHRAVADGGVRGKYVLQP